MGLRSLIARAAFSLALVCLPLAAPAVAWALDDGQPGPGERWEPGQILVRFANRARAAERKRIARAAGVKLGTHLPLVPDLWQVTTRDKVLAAAQRLDKQHGVLYVQPNYIDHSTSDAGPSDAAYWPNDPYFWPARFANPDDCTDSSVLGGWPLWPQGNDLTAAGALGLQFNPLAPDQQFVGPRGRYPSYHSINVLPVWNLLKAAGRLRSPRLLGWTDNDLERYGIAIDDTGISNHPDLTGQIAALFSVVTDREAGDQGARTRIREVFRDNPGRNDLGPIRDTLTAAGKDTIQVQNVKRPLFALDDAAVRYPNKWKPIFQGEPLPPAGCDGHGTAVASIAAARADNGIGLAGVGYNVPVVGIRVGMPWDQPGVPYPRNPDPVVAAAEGIQAWEQWRQTASLSDEDAILRFELVKALRLPVLNMSYGAAMVTYLPDARGRTRRVLLYPAVAEALARLLSDGVTLGVASAGNTRQYYGRGRDGRGANLSGLGQTDVSGPCGLKLVPTIGAWTSSNLRAPGADNRRNPDARANAPFNPPGVDWSRVELLCVAAASPNGKKLWASSGRGDSVVQIAAPGKDISVANRPSVLSGAAGAYHRGNGTSYAAPMVSGAAALLRRAAPDAPIDEIRLALERGARQSSDLRGKVLYGALDVACALRALNDRKQRSWDMINIAPQPDPGAYSDFIQSTSSCREKSSEYEEYGLPITTADVFDPARNNDAAGRFPTTQAWIDSLNLDPGPESSSLTWQAGLIGDRPWAGGRAVFPIRPGRPTPMDPPQRPVYESGFINVGCRKEGYRISGISLGFTSLVKPSGWVLPTDAQPPTKRIQLAVALAKPWYQALLPKELFVRASVRCDFYPGVN